MANTLATSLMEQEQFTERNRWLDQLSNYVIVDMGIISSPVLTTQGMRCRVKPFRLMMSQQVVYEGVEVIVPGNSAGGINFDLEGASCIIFGPYSSSVSVSQRNVLGTNLPYDIKYLKCMPVGNPAYWKNTIEFDTEGNCRQKTRTSSVLFGSDGSIVFNQLIPKQRISVSSDGSFRWSDPVSFCLRKTDGAYYRYLRGVEPGSFSKLESFQGNILDIYYTTIAAFEEEDGELTEWEQLIAFNKWSRRERHDYATGDYYHYIRGSEEGKIQYFESFVANVRNKYWGSLEAISEEDGDEEDKWEQLADVGDTGWRRHENHDETSGVSFVKLYDADGNLLSKEEFNPDGSRLLTNTDAEDTVLFSRVIAADGSVVIEIGDGSYTLDIAADGTVTETQKGAKSITSDGALTIDSGDAATITSVGKMTIESDDAIDLMSTAAGKIKIGNQVKTLFYFLDNLYTNLTSLHTEGSPAAHTGASWAASFVPADKALLSQVFQ